MSRRAATAREIIDRLVAAERRRSASGEGHLVPPLMLESLKAAFPEDTGALLPWQRRLLADLYTSAHEEQSVPRRRIRRISDCLRRFFSSGRHARG